jgi:hypothetical protein
MTGNGTVRAHAPTADAFAGRFDFQQWYALTEKAIAECERRLEVAQQTARAAAAAVEAHQQELVVLRRALTGSSERPAPTGGAVTPAAAGRPPTILRGVRTGKGPGSQSAAYLLEVARVRVHVKAEKRQGSNGHATVDLALDGGEALTPETIALSCKGWARSTVRDGLRRLVDDGMLERTSPGTFRLTEAGLAHGPAGAATLPLLEPTEPPQLPPPTLVRVGGPLE